MSKTFDGLMQALLEVNAHQEGKTNLPTHRVEMEAPDVRGIRKRLKLSQERFAGLFGFSLPAVRAWEQGKRQPDISVRHYLRVIEKNPKAVVEALRYLRRIFCSAIRVRFYGRRHLFYRNLLAGTYTPLRN